ncbi:bifunctional homocysteine S-methyltransferase/methylenetetrahydrofolate reductase [Alicyclobacillus dauci]|uniref:bifunctional homocysteine S-methyltransferase/methylenetetrahydrofolate reductase n=1 Tax=Alicyclobacillus dauci TaxID=1475485 RepID=UPI002DD43E21|nr:bifunctional homocysteine S-methyltransferase/methylenetetrahydrofolate reductase [Alicyclobacillus dauci]
MARTESLSLTVGTFAAVPNGGILQRSENDALSYTGDEQNFADVMLEIAKLGVTWLGGCCGTTPAHIRVLVERLQELGAVGELADFNSPVRKRESDANRTPARVVEETPYEVIRPMGESLVDKLKTQATVIVELDPPKTLECERFIQGARELRAAGADMITMADNSLGTVRVSNMALASMLKQFGIEPLVHVTCRDRNLIGQQSHLMGLHVLGIRNILLITGDPSRYGDLPGASSVYDVSSIDLTKMVRRLNEGVGFSGKQLKKPAQFVIGTAFNPHVRNFPKAVERLRRKVEAGADYVMTQPVYDERTMEQIALATRDLGVPVMIGIMPLTSLRNAEFLHHQVPGITIPEDVLLAMREATPDQAGEAGYQLAERLCDAALSYFRGIYLVTPFLKYDLTVRLTQHIRMGSLVTP